MTDKLAMLDLPDRIVASTDAWRIVEPTYSFNKKRALNFKARSAIYFA
jgi:hypothetical protein